jgi:D-cysteine desulfhydrase
VTPSALDTLELLLAHAAELFTVPHWSALPLGMAALRARTALASERALIMPPGGATPRAVLAYVSAGLELALQVEQGLLPVPRRVYAAAGSNATSAGLLAGFALAARMGLGFRARPPELCAVRIGPWPITSRTRILDLSRRTLALLARLTRDPTLELDARELGRSLSVRGEFLGRGYARRTPLADEACRVFSAVGLPWLDETYSGKAGAALIADLRAGAAGPLLLWSTKSSSKLPEPAWAGSSAAPRALRRWLERARRESLGP